MRPVVAIFTIALMILCAPAVQAAQVVDRIVASVNGEIITLSDLDRRSAKLIEVRKLTDQDQIDKLRREVLEAMIEKILVMQEADRVGLTVEEKEIDNELERFLEGNHLTREKFELDLRERGVTWDAFREDVRGDITRRKLMASRVRQAGTVTDAEVDAFIRQYGARPPSAPTGGPPIQGGQVHLRNILVFLDRENPQADMPKKEALIKKIYEELQGGMSFADAAVKYSQAPNAAQGGDLGVIAWQDLAPVVREALENLQNGQISRPLLAGPAIQMFQLVERLDEGAAAAAPAQAAPTAAAGPGEATAEDRERVRQLLANKRLEEQYGSWIQELKSKAIIEIRL